MPVRLFLLISNAATVNIGFLCAFLIRYGMVLPERNFLPYKKNFIFLTLTYVSALSAFRVYKGRFKSSWDLFKRVFLGLLFGTLLSIAFVYAFRTKYGAFPTSVFVLSFFVNLLLIFKPNQLILKAKKKIRKKIVVIGDDDIDELPGKKATVERIKIDEFEQLVGHTDADEILICEKIRNAKALSLLVYFVQKLKIDVVLSPSNYMELLSERINDEASYDFLDTFVGKKPGLEEFLIRSLDIVGSLIILLIFAPVILVVSALTKVTSPGPVFYKQERVGRHGKVFTLYKFRTMVRDAERNLGPVLASPDDPRITKVGKLLRRARLDELPQLFNVLRGDMSLVGPRPERPHFVKLHNALRELRLVVRPGMTGLAQIRSFYDLKPQHKIRYDYLYIQRRSLLLNLYILAKTIRVVLQGKGR